MFRLIAICLAVTFALLGLAGTDQPSPFRQAQLISLGAATGKADKVEQLRIGQRFVIQSTSNLKDSPDKGAAQLGDLLRGTSVLLLSTATDGYVRVRDHAGRVGYLSVAALTPAS